jgi:SAM-dependent methyltransferase
MSQWSGGDGGLDYEAGRPEWPPEVQAFLAGLRPRVALDLGAGTGKLTRHLVAIAPEVIAVDPAAGLLDVLRIKVPRADARVGTAEAIPLPRASVDLVAAGNAFHWFHGEAAADEIARVLVPGGAVAIFWNRPEWPEWFAGVSARLADYRNVVHDAAADRAESGRWREPLERRFGVLETADIARRRHTWTREGFGQFLRSTSYIAALDRRRREQALQAADAYLATLEQPLVVPHVTEVAVARARSAWRRHGSSRAQGGLRHAASVGQPPRATRPGEQQEDPGADGGDDEAALGRALSEQVDAVDPRRQGCDGDRRREPSERLPTGPDDPDAVSAVTARPHREESGRQEQHDDGHDLHREGCTRADDAAAG